jgi:hypothetical protein
VNGSTLSGELEAISKAEKAAAEARTARAAADKAEREEREAASPLARSKQEAETQKAISEAHQAATEHQQKQISALLPDLGKVTPGSLETKGEGSLFGTSLAEQATAAAAKLVAKVAVGALTEQGSVRILVTSDTDLASSDAIYVEVMNGLGQLITAATSLIDRVDLPTESQAATAPAAEGLLPLAPVIGALTAAIPGALSLISAHRTLSTSPVTVDSLAAAAVVAGHLAARDPATLAVFHDDVRLLPEGGEVQSKLSTLAGHRQVLIGKKLTLEDEKATKDAELIELTAQVKDSSNQLDKATGAERSSIETTLDRLRGEVEACEVQISKRTVRIGLLDSTTAAIDQFTGSLRATAEGAKHTPLTAAILREQLHAPAGAKKFTHLLMVKAQPGSAQQLTEDRLLKDRFSTIATSSVTYMLVETGEGRVVRSGSIGGEARIIGSLGKDFSMEARSIKAGEE